MAIRVPTLAFLCLAFLACTLATASAGEVTLEDVLIRYNAGIERTMAAIETLRVEQEIVEPTDEGGEKRARSVLTYRRDEGMERDEVFSDLGHPMGDYSLESLVGPVILTSEYDVSLAGPLSMESRSCYRLDVIATERDSKHFDGSVWVETDTWAPVRITGEVADAPWPARRVKLDKVFAPVSEGLYLLRTHSAEVDIKIAFVSKHGVADIHYTDYSVSVGGDSRDGDTGGAPR